MSALKNATNLAIAKGGDALNDEQVLAVVMETLLAWQRLSLHTNRPHVRLGSWGYSKTPTVHFRLTTCNLGQKKKF
jgi:hypothetical protein